MRTDKQTAEDTTNTAAQIAGAIGKGIVAGLIGTAAMTIAQMIEMQLSGRDSSDAPYQAAKKVFGVKVEDEESKETVNNLMHFAYGTAWGIPRALLAEFGSRGAAGTATHFGAVWGAALIMLPSLDLSEPVTEWEPEAIGKDALLHGVYAVVTGLAADALASKANKNREA